MGSVKKMMAESELSPKILKDARRYQYLRDNCFKPKYPNSEFDHAYHLSFTVSGVWADAANPAVLDSLIDIEMGKKK